MKPSSHFSSCVPLPFIHSFFLSTMTTTQFVPVQRTARQQEMIVQRRIRNDYDRMETRAEAQALFRELLHGEQLVLGLNVYTGIMGYLDEEALARQKASWLADNASCRRRNIMEVDMGGGLKGWFFVVQPAGMTGENTPYSALGLAFNILVSGYGFIVLNKALAEQICDELS